MAVKRRVIILVAIFVILVVAVWGYTVMQENMYKQEIAEKYGIDPSEIKDIKTKSHRFVGTVTVIELENGEEYAVADSVIQAGESSKLTELPGVEFDPGVLKFIDYKIYAPKPQGVDWDRLVNETVMMLINKSIEYYGENVWLDERGAIWYIDGRWIYSKYFGENPTGRIYGARLGGWYQANESVRIMFWYDPERIPDPYNWTIQHMFQGHSPDEVVMFYIQWLNGTYVIYEQLVPVMKNQTVNEDFGVFIVGIQKLFGDPRREYGCEKIGPDESLQAVPGCYLIMLIFDEDGNLLYAFVA